MVLPARWIMSACAIIGLFSADLASAPRLASVFGDQMVLQQGRPVSIWGWAEAGEKIQVEFAGQKKGTEAGDDGNWSVTLEPLEVSFENRELVVEGASEKVTLARVLVGEVWLCGGQSNMAMTLRSSVNRDLEIASADYTAIRFLRVPLISRGAPQQDLPAVEAGKAEGNWQTCTPDRVGDCSGVAYYFGRRLHRLLKVPVGLVDVSWGGTMAQHWVSEEKLRPLGTMQPYFEDYEQRLARWETFGGEAGARKAYELALATWEKDNEEALKKGERVPGRPNAGQYEDPSTQRHPAGMYNGMIHPIRDFVFRGILFYQGENNSFGVSWKPYPHTLPLVIKEWRERFGELPFGIIQIAGWSNRRSMTYDMNHHTNVIREVQFDVWQRTEKSGLIVTYDTNSNQSIHPGAKQPVGDRSARWALSEVYMRKDIDGRQPLSWKGPIYESHEVRDGRLVISFTGKTARGLRLDQDDEVGFYIAGDDREFHHARVRVIREENVEKLVVWSDEVEQAVAVRYAWSNLPVGRLMNHLELPAYPFRTDDWPLTPHQSTGDYHRGTQK